MSGEANTEDSGEILVEVEGDDDTITGADPADGGLRSLEQQVEALQKEKQEVYERLLRSTADFDNFRKRSRRDLNDARGEARSRVLKEILPVVDNLERALQHAETVSEASGVVDGVKLVLRQFGQALTRCEVVAIDAAGKPFDPMIHEAISQKETDEHPPGTVCDVVQKGYMIGERLLRPSMVVVSKGKAEASAQDDAETEFDTSPDTEANGSTQQPEDSSPAGEVAEE